MKTKEDIRQYIEKTDLSREAKNMLLQVNDCESLDDVRRLVFKWHDEGLFARLDSEKREKRESI